MDDRAFPDNCKSNSQKINVSTAAGSSYQWCADPIFQKREFGKGSKIPHDILNYDCTNRITNNNCFILFGINDVGW